MTEFDWKPVKFLIVGNVIIILCGVCFFCAYLGVDVASNLDMSTISISNLIPETATPTPVLALQPTFTPTPALPDAAPTPVSPVAFPSPEPTSLSGTGQQISTQFALDEGLAVFKMTHTGSSNFVVSLVNLDGQPDRLLVNTIGQFNGSKALPVQAGNYVLDITADGGWTVNIEHPVPSAALISFPLTGQGEQATGFFVLGQGPITFNLTHAGSQNFMVTLLDQNGQPVDILANEVGPFAGNKTVEIQTPGAYLLDISANGDWSITTGP